ncbi:VanZ family protein [Candidatus Gottesmanbacteria bacterium]|nr:VanZ family protein [Candidatus Gottesmanbacteria bacterium]
MEKQTKKERLNINVSTPVWVYWLPVVCWMAVIFFLSSRHSVTVSPEYFWNFMFFKTLHIIEYAVLFTLTLRATHRSGGTSMKKSAYLRAYIITVLYAMTDEIHQQFVPSRQGAVRDVIIDAIGAGVVWYYLLTQLPKAQKTLKNWANRLEIPY